ncbi:MAG: GNAT family N-acetyltransferase [Gemmatimonadales bacterium]
MHARDLNWVPPFRRDVGLLLSRTKNPFFEHGEAEYFLAHRGARAVGRIAAITNRLHNERHQDRVGFFGFFEAEDQEATDELFREAGDWLRARGFDRIRGPASFSVNDEYGLLVEGFDTPNTIMMPHNPASYPDLVVQAGFTGVKNLIVYQAGDPNEYWKQPERIVRAVALSRERYGITVRSLRMADFKHEVDHIKALYNRCWEDNWGAVPMTDHEIDHLAEQFKPVVIPELVPFAEKDGRPVGFGLALPDFNEVLRTNRRGRMFPAAIKLLWALKRKKMKRCRILLLGVLPEFRSKGVDAILYQWIWEHAFARNISWGEGGWILEDNPAMNQGLLKLGMTPYKTYRVYERAL